MGIIDDFNLFKGTLNPRRFPIVLDGVFTGYVLQNDMIDQYVFKQQRTNTSIPDDQRISVRDLLNKYDNKQCLDMDPLFNLLDSGDKFIELRTGLNSAKYVEETREVHIYSNAFMQSLDYLNTDMALGHYIRDKTRLIFNSVSKTYNPLLKTSYGLSSKLKGKFPGLIGITTGFTGVEDGVYNIKLKNKIGNNNLKIAGNNLEFIMDLPNAIPFKADNENDTNRTLLVHKIALINYLIGGTNYTDNERALVQDNRLMWEVLNMLTHPEVSSQIGTVIQLGRETKFTTIPIDKLVRDKNPMGEYTYAQYVSMLNPVLENLKLRFTDRVKEAINE